jgi:hypothetical protein
MITFRNVEAVLDSLNEKTPELFSKSLLIGGWCALIYYQALADANDQDYPAPIPESRDRLQSNDVDFTHVWKGDFFEALPEFVVEPPHGPAYLQIAGMRLGFAQVPEAIDPEEAFEKSRKLRTRAGTVFSILDPVRLYRGKQAMVQKRRGKANDAFHLQIAETYARFELAEAIRKHALQPGPARQQRVENLILEMKNLVPELLPRTQRPEA